MSLYDTPPDLLARLPGLAAARIKEALPGLRQCQAMAGRLDVDRLKEKGIATPAVLVTRLRCRQDKTYGGPLPTYRVQMAAFILCKDELGLARDLAAANIAQVLLRLVPDQIWGLRDHVGGAEAVTEEPLVSIASDKAALALTAVTWEQVVGLSDLPGPEPIVPELYVGGQQIGGAP